MICFMTLVDNPTGCASLGVLEALMGMCEHENNAALQASTISSLDVNFY